MVTDKRMQQMDSPKT